MSDRELFRDVGVLKKLEARLAELEEVRRFNTFEHNEANTLAHAFHDLEGSFRTLLDKHFVRLAEKGSNGDLNSILLDIGEEFRHILYHIRDPAFYGYLNEDTEDDAGRHF
jgi:hypothetical protein